MSHKKFMKNQHECRLKIWLHDQDYILGMRLEISPKLRILPIGILGKNPVNLGRSGNMKAADPIPMRFALFNLVINTPTKVYIAAYLLRLSQCFISALGGTCPEIHFSSISHFLPLTLSS